jgi:hypothetical protein
VTFVLDSVVYWRFSLGMEAWMPVFAAAFRAYGLPHAIRCDNGAPFGWRKKLGALVVLWKWAAIQTQG